MNCRNVQRKLSAYIDGELTGAEMMAIRSHLSRCPECAREERSIRAFKRLLGAMPCVEPPSGLEERLLGAIRREHKQSASWWPQIKWASVAACAAGLAMFAILTFVKRPGGEAVAADTAEFTVFDATRDQAYVAGSDPLSFGPLALPTGDENR